MKKLLTIVAIFATTSSYADYVSHSFVDANVEPSECLKAGKSAAKAIGIDKTYLANDVVVYGMNKEGYSLQFTCVTRKGASYYIINGAHSKKRVKYADKFYVELKNQFSKIIASHKK